MLRDSATSGAIRGRETPKSGSPDDQEDGVRRPDAGENAAVTPRVDLIRVLRALFEGPLPVRLAPEIAGASPQDSGRMIALLVAQGIVVARSRSSWSGTETVAYGPGVDEIVRRILEGAGLPADARPMTHEEAEAFVGLLKPLVRLGLSRDRG